MPGPGGIMLPSETFGRLLARYREAVPLTQSELAERMGYSLDAIKSWENGTRLLRPAAFNKITPHLNLSKEQEVDLWATRTDMVNGTSTRDACR